MILRAAESRGCGRGHDVLEGKKWNGAEVCLLPAAFHLPWDWEGGALGFHGLGGHGDFRGVKMTDRQSLSPAGHCAEDLMWFGKCGVEDRCSGI